MFFKKKLKNQPYFIFNYGCKVNEKCVSLSVENGIASADWYDDNNTRHLIENGEVNEEFWDSLLRAMKENGVLEWPAHRLFNRFASEITLEVFNAEGLFPSGERFDTNNLHGLPEGFEEATAALTRVFESFFEK